MKGVNRRNVATNIPAANRGNIGEAAFNPDTRDWISRTTVAGGGVLHSDQVRVHNFVTHHYRSGLRAITGTGHLITYCLLFHKTVSLTGCNVPLWAPSGVGNATLNNFVSGDWNTNGLKGNGSTKFVDTLFVPSTHMAGDANASILAWETEKADTPPTATYALIGSFSGASNVNRLMITPNTGTTAYTVRMFWSGPDALESAVDVRASGYVIGITQASVLPGQIYTQLNNTLIANRTSGVVNTNARPNRPVYVFARSDDNPATTSLYGNSRIKAVAFGNGLTVAQMQQQYSLFERLG